ncbi:hypothetical protein [Sphingomonas abietis]|uniref:Porin n=1 Tax=Sphingomonas abietis TaxID=3012344 RepID=A0ABY7NQD8_9SPHN|nr:hypothetical protein [Sphingomonas abietis]WBO23180.1 hypothetical protein PBT88_03310 [Sphingomonas abietis]
MTSKFNLLAGASIGVAMIAAGPALAKPVKHIRHAAAKSNSNAEIDALKAQVEALTARLDAQEQNSAQATAAINQASTQAAAAQASAQAAQTQAVAAQTAVPTEVKTQLASLPKPKNAWANDTSISGRMYFNFSNISMKSNGAKNAADGTGFNIKRLYIGVDHTFNSVFSANFTTDISNVVGSTANANAPANSATSPAASTALVGKGFYVKKAYLQAKLNPALIVRLGAADMPWIPYAENQYGYRHVELTLIDRTNYGTSSDWGVHVLGDLAGGLLSYQFSVVDGAGYRNVKVSKSVDFEGRVSTSYKGFYAAAGGYSGKRGNDTQNLALPTGLDHVRTASRENAMVGYKNKMFNLGGEYFHAKNWNNTTTVVQDKSDGYSAFGNVNFAKQWSVFGRYDWVKPNKETNPDLKDHYYNVGLQWEPVKIVDLALVYKRDRAENGTISTQNGTIGGSREGIYHEIGLFGQLRF